MHKFLSINFAWFKMPFPYNESNDFLLFSSFVIVNIYPSIPLFERLFNNFSSASYLISKLQVTSPFSILSK